jgi:hypothetical protein
MLREFETGDRHDTSFLDCSTYNHRSFEIGGCDKKRKQGVLAAVQGAGFVGNR